MPAVKASEAPDRPVAVLMRCMTYPIRAGGRGCARAALRGLFVFLNTLLLVVGMGPGFAKDAAQAGMSRLALEVIINDQPTKLIGDIYRAGDGRLFATRDELVEIGIQPPGKGDGKDMIGFDAIPGLSMRYAEADQKLHLGAPDSIRVARKYDLNTASALSKVSSAELSRDIGMVVNYNAYGTAARGYSGASRTYTTGTLSLDGRIFSPLGMVQNSAVLGNSLSKEGVLRLETSYVFAHQDSATTTTFGDAVSGGLNWTRPARLGGAQISRSFALRPDLVTAPLPSVAGSAAVPSTVDVYVDNMRIASQDVGAGPFRITNIPVSGESGNARVVVRDVTGKETTTSLPFFTSAKLLAPGAFDFSVEAGYPRLNYALQSFDYSKKIIGQGSFRYGWTDTLTVEGHAEGTQKLALAGAGATYNAGRLGTFSLAGSGSWHGGDWGALGFASWQTSWKGFFLGANTQRTFGHYTDIAAVTATTAAAAKLNSNFLDSGFFVLNRSANVPRALDRLSVGKTFESLNATLSASFVNVERSKGDVSRLATVTWSQTFEKKYNAFVTLFSDFGSQRRTGAVAGLAFTLGDDILVNASAGLTGSERSANLDISRPVGNKEYDYGWRLYDLESKSSSRGAQAAFRSPYSRASAGVRQEGTSLGGFGELDGAAIVTPSGVFASRRVHDAFAVVDVGAPGVEVLHENRPVGRSGPFGKVLVTDVPSFQRTKIAISPESLPGETHASVTEAEIMPNFRGSATVNIKTISARDTATIEIVNAKGEHLQPGTRALHVESGHSFTIGYNGKTFVPQIAESNTLKIQIRTQACEVRFSKSDRQGSKGLIGPLICALQ